MVTEVVSNGQSCKLFFRLSRSQWISNLRESRGNNDTVSIFIGVALFKPGSNNLDDTPRMVSFDLSFRSMSIRGYCWGWEGVLWTEGKHISWLSINRGSYCGNRVKGFWWCLLSLRRCVSLGGGVSSGGFLSWINMTTYIYASCSMAAMLWKNRRWNPTLDGEGTKIATKNQNIVKLKAGATPPPKNL